MKILVAGLFLLVVVLYTALTKMSVGLPIRTLVLVFLAAVLFTCYFNEARRFFEKHVVITGMFFALGTIGSVLTYVNQRSVSATFEGLTSNILQPYLIFFCTFVLIRLLGMPLVATITFTGAFLTGLTAIIQYFQINAAWRIREFLSDVQDESSAIRAYVANRGRSIGLSVTPIVFSYHMMCAYVALNALYRFKYIRWVLYYGSVGLLSIATFANGTRSVLLGIAVSEMVMELRKRTLKSMLKVGAIFLAGAALYLYAEYSGSRIAETDDDSALGRFVLLNYGLLLAADNPFGLGWDFDAAGYAWLYWEYLSDSVNADGVFRLGLHNAFLNYFLIYGLGGTLLAFIALLYDPRFVFEMSLYLSSYIVHAFFHNNGMFIGDYFFWFTFAILLHVMEENGMVYGSTGPPAPNPVFMPQRPRLAGRSY